MKQKALLLLILTANMLCSVSAQNLFKLEQQQNGYQAGDSIYKYQIEYKDPGGVGQELQWDFSNVHIIDDHYLIKYFHPDRKDTTRMCGMEHRTRYYYSQHNDSLLATGFENYTTRMDYTTPELKMKYPFQYGDTL